MSGTVCVLITRLGLVHPHVRYELPGDSGSWSDFFPTSFLRLSSRCGRISGGVRDGRHRAPRACSQDMPFPHTSDKKMPVTYLFPQSLPECKGSIQGRGVESYQLIAGGPGRTAGELSPSGSYPRMGDYGAASRLTNGRVEERGKGAGGQITWNLGIATGLDRWTPL